MQSLSNAINNGVRAWAKDFAEAHGLVDVGMFWSVSTATSRVVVWGSPKDKNSPSAASAALARWAVALNLIHTPSDSFVYVGHIIYEGFVDNWKVQISVLVDQAANDRARREHDMKRVG
ncbi:hypothetical protein [Umezawaea sp. Da 62-37]|uniref:hypothetical protein n=1 Tax=Umezawaea sp. Da 62-37 TaxID=3075927 RepID=UPI0028F70ACA|nr:hypothetical protein [Umezawaea sp. Da 62-37]WNV82919.1 hypothetical protein RM788_32600 [Umezawaea sp. Da 62-37]